MRYYWFPLLLIQKPLVVLQNVDFFQYCCTFQPRVLKLFCKSRIYLNFVFILWKQLDFPIIFKDGISSVQSCSDRFDIERECTSLSVLELCICIQGNRLVILLNWPRSDCFYNSSNLETNGFPFDSKSVGGRWIQSVFG